MKEKCNPGRINQVLSLLALYPANSFPPLARCLERTASQAAVTAAGKGTRAGWERSSPGRSHSLQVLFVALEIFGSQAFFSAETSLSNQHMYKLLRSL